MDYSIFINRKFIVPRIGAIPLYVPVVILVFILAVLQDYIYSNLKSTGFHLSESMLYNTIWIFFIPFTLLVNRLVKSIYPSKKWQRVIFHLGTGLTFSILHILVFTTMFVLISNLVYTTPHRFPPMLKTALSNHFYIAFLWYMLFPAFYFSAKKLTKTINPHSKTIKVKSGSKITSVQSSSIILISTNKPYSTIITEHQKILSDKSLKEFEAELDPKSFTRVHRSTIINTSFVEELNSRSNGDYDAKLKNGQVVRLSRHYRDNWLTLLH